MIGRMYAKKTGSTWATETVDTGGTTDVAGRYPSLAFGF